MTSPHSRLVPLVLSLGLVGCPAVTAAPDTLVVATAVFPESLEGGARSFAALSLAYQTLDPLIQRDDDGNLQPGLALAWEATDDTTWRIEFRPSCAF